MKKLNTTLFFVLLSVQFSLAQVSPIVQNILNQVNQDSVFYFVKELSGNVPTNINGTNVTIASRNKNYPGNDQATEYIKQKLQYYGLATTIQTFSGTGKNVYAVQPGYMYPNKKFIICGHMDSMPTGPVAPGADDNASGTAAVLEAARILKNYSFPFTIVYALWDEEEQGLIGSAYYANAAFNAGDSIMGVLNMDMIAYDGNNDGTCNVHTRAVGSSLQLSSKMIQCNTDYGLNLNIVIKNPGSTYSDHASFWSKGYGSILLIEDNNDFHPQYHTVNDVISYFNIPYFVKMTKLTLATLGVLALDLNMTILHTPIASMEYTGPIQTSATVQTGLRVGTGTAAPRLYYRINQGSGYTQFNAVTGIPGSGANFNFTIPQIASGSSVQYYIAAQDSGSSIVATLPSGGGGFNPPGSTPPASFYQFFVAPQAVALLDSANSTANWTSSGGWATTTTKFVSPPSSFTESPSGQYGINLTASLTYTSTIPLTNVLGAVLEFDTQWATEVDYDYGQIRLSTNGGTTWIPLQGLYTNPGVGSFQPPGQPLYDGSQTTWVRESIDISQYLGQQIKLQFYFRSDPSLNADGWYVDNITIKTYSIIPVELVMFTAEASSDGVILKWATSTETNNRGFEIQRSKDGSNWKEISFVNGRGTTSETNYYSYSDAFYGSGLAYYRLIQKDFDGSVKAYPAVEIDLTGTLSYTLGQNYPNPFNPITHINYSVPQAGRVKISVYNLIGEEVALLLNEVKEPGKYQVVFDGSGLSSGVYMYRMEGENFRDVKKLVLMK